MIVQRAEPPIDSVEFRGLEAAEPTEEVSAPSSPPRPS